jgi:purine-binding chemotaxis protein CheW
VSTATAGGHSASRPSDDALLVFTLGPSRCAVRASTVREVVRAVAISALPGAPAVVDGVINFRGRIVPVVDPRRRFGLPPVPLGPDQHFIAALAGSRLVALRVDQAVELITVGADAVERAAGGIPNAPYVAGVARLPDGLLVIYDLERFLSLDEAVALEAALKTRP